MTNRESWWHDQTTTNYEFRKMEPEELSTFEPFLAEGFRRIWGEAFSEETLEVARNKINTRALLVIFIREKGSESSAPQAFITIKMVDDFGMLSVSVEDGFNTWNKEDDVLAEGLAFCKHFARVVGANYVQFSSTRQGWRKVAPKLGYRLKFIKDGREHYSTGV